MKPFASSDLTSQQQEIVSDVKSAAMTAAIDLSQRELSAGRRRVYVVVVV